jgi:DNA-binding CsgD family transcriptional regulator
VAVIVVPGPKPSQYSVIHLLQSLPEKRGEEELVPLGTPLAAAVSPAAPTRPPAHSPLSAREVEVLRLLADGVSTSAVADSLFISVATVRNHIQKTLRKLDVHSKLEAVALALRSRLI